MGMPMYLPTAPFESDLFQSVFVFCIRNSSRGIVWFDEQIDVCGYNSVNRKMFVAITLHPIWQQQRSKHNDSGLGVHKSLDK
jgi:hypothetical protein